MVPRVPFEVFWDRLKNELMTGRKDNTDKKWYWTIPKWSSAGRVSGKPLSCIYEGDDIIYFITGNDRKTSAHKDEFEKFYPEWEQYCEGKERSEIERELNLRKTSYTIPTLRHFKHLMH
jgi:hypothetical protein